MCSFWVEEYCGVLIMIPNHNDPSLTGSLHSYKIFMNLSLYIDARDTFTTIGLYRMKFITLSCMGINLDILLVQLQALCTTASSMYNCKLYVHMVLYITLHRLALDISKF